MKTSELTGAALDWAVAKCNGKTLYYFVDDPFKKDPWLTVDGNADQPLHSYTPSTDWSQGGPIIEREDFHRIVRNLGQGYTVSKKLVVLTDDGEVIRWVHGVGPTILIAAMRCYVASKSGDDIEIPTELGETK
jgi:hypothetical protein